MTPMTIDELIGLGAEYIDHGVPVFAIRLEQEADRIAKKPVTVNGHRDATLDIEVLRAQLTATTHPVKGIGIVPGAGGYVVLDYDTKNGARGDLVLERHRAEHGDDADAVTYTSISGAVNVIHRKVVDVAIGNTSPWGDVDVRADAGWIVPPGVRTPWGEWGWRSGSLEDVQPMPAGLWSLLKQASEQPSAPVDVATCREWLNAGAEVTDAVENMRMRRHLHEIAHAANRNPALFDALTELRRADPGYIDRREWFDLIVQAWRKRMADDGIRNRDDEPLSVLTRVVGHDHYVAEIAAQKATEDALTDGPYVPLNLTPWIEGDMPPIEPDLLTLDDGRGMLYRDRINLIYGDSNTGKSWMIAKAIMQEAAQGRRVMVIDFEDTPRTLIQRLRQLGADDDLLHMVVMICPEEPPEPHVDAIIDAIEKSGAEHVFMDSLGQSFGMSGVDENHDLEVAAWLDHVVGRIERFGVGSTLIDHGTKAKDAPLHPSGTKRKKAALTGAAWLLETDQPFTKDREGSVRLRCAKDRHGNYAVGEHEASMRMMHISGEGSDLRSMLTLDAVNPQERPQEVDNRTAEELMVIAAESVRDWQSREGLYERARVLGISRRLSEMRGGVDEAVRRGFLEQMTGPRGAKLIRYVSDWEPFDSTEYLRGI